MNVVMFFGGKLHFVASMNLASTITIASKNIQFCQLLQDHILNLWRRRWCNFQRFIYLVFQNATWAYPNFPHEIWHIIKNQTITTIFDTNVWTVYWDYGSNIYLLALMIYFKHTSMDAILNYSMHLYLNKNYVKMYIFFIFYLVSIGILQTLVSTSKY